jgi:hypothetical protein
MMKNKRAFEAVLANPARLTTYEQCCLKCERWTDLHAETIASLQAALAPRAPGQVGRPMISYTCACGARSIIFSPGQYDSPGAARPQIQRYTVSKK